MTLSPVPRSWKGPLHAGTLDLHHHIETETEVGRAMTNGTPSAVQYAGWLKMKAAFFAPVERYMLPAARRSELYRADYEAMGVQIPDLDAAAAHEAWLLDESLTATERERRRTGTIYVCAGSVFGSAVIRQQITSRHPEWPVSSLAFRDQTAEIAYLAQLRHRADCILEARVTFASMVSACEQIAAASRDMVE